MKLFAISDPTWHQRHHWWCIFWQWIHEREPNDYDGVCLNCEKDRYDYGRTNAAIECLKRGKTISGKFYEDGKVEVDDENFSD